MKTKSVRTKLLAIKNWSELAIQAEYRASRLATLCEVTKKSLQRYFRAQRGVLPQQWLDDARDFEAERLMAAGKRTKEIAYLLGYKSPSDLCHHFKRARGISLKQWKQKFCTRAISKAHEMSPIDNL